MAHLKYEEVVRMSMLQVVVQLVGVLLCYDAYQLYTSSNDPDQMRHIADNPGSKHGFRLSPVIESTRSDPCCKREAIQMS